QRKCDGFPPCLALTAGAVDRGALTLANAFESRRAAWAGLAATPVNGKFLAEITGLAVAADKVTKCGSAGENSLVQHRLDLLGKPDAFGAAQATGGAAGPQTGHEQRFIGVDVSHSHHHLAVHDEGLAGHAPIARAAKQVVAIEGLAERFRAEIAQQWMLFRIVRGPEQGAEAPRVRIAQCGGV